MNAKKPRLVLIVPVFPQISETFIVSKFVGLADRGWDVHLVCNRREAKNWSKYPELERRPGLSQRVHPCWLQRPRWLAAVLLLFALLRGFVSAPRSAWNYLSKGFRMFGWRIFKYYYLDLELICLQPDILHFEFGSLAVGKTYLKQLLNCRLTISFRGHDLNFSGLGVKGYFDEVWGQADACHFLGEDLWRRAISRGCPIGMPHRLIAPAIEISTIPFVQKPRGEILGTPERPVKILSVGRLDWIKGYEFGLVTVKLLQQAGITLQYRIVGDGNLREAIYFARHQLGLESSVEFCGSLSHSATLDQLAWADLFLHSAVSEGFCNAVMEAQAAGLPVVATNAGALPENVADGITGFIVKRRDPAALAEKLTVLIKDETLRRSMGEAGHTRMKTIFGIERQLDAIENFYDSLNLTHT